MKYIIAILAAVAVWVFLSIQTLAVANEALAPETPPIVIRPTYLVANEIPGYQQTVETFRVTAYSLDDPGMRPSTAPNYGQTASGVYVQEGVTVACGSAYPFGTVFVIEGIGARVCQDRGRAIDDGDLDLYISQRTEAVQFGVQELRALVVREGDAQ